MVSRRRRGPLALYVLLGVLILFALSSEDAPRLMEVVRALSVLSY